MRIVAGVVGGREIKGPAGSAARPTTDKVRAAIFNSLESLDVVQGAKVVDLFAGTGACGIEALSRGAESVTFVEKSPENARLIRANLKSLDLQGEVKVQDVLRFLEASPRFDLAIADPPYAFDLWPALLGSLNADVLVCESNRSVDPDENWTVIRSKKYGGTHLTTMKKSS